MAKIAKRNQNDARARRRRARDEDGSSKEDRELPPDSSDEEDEEEEANVAAVLWAWEPTEGCSPSTSGAPPRPMVVRAVTKGPSEVH